MFKPFAIIFFVVVFTWMGSILITTDPQTRIYRSCVVLNIGDRVATGAAQLVHEPWASTVHEAMTKTIDSCHFLVWKVFYEAAFVREKTAVPARREESQADEKESKEQRIEKSRLKNPEENKKPEENKNRDEKLESYY